MARPRRTPATAEPSVVHARPEKQLAVTHDQHPSPAPSDPAGLNPSQLQHHEPPGAVRAEREPGPGLFSQDSDLFLDPQIGALLYRPAEGLLPTRLILQDYWLFRDEVLHFAQGRLHLSGHNGSGKSTALVAAITLLLDGDTSPARLDPFGSRQRTMRYYLLGGEDKGFHLRSRRAYLALEFRAPDGQYQTIGLGLAQTEGGELKKTGFWLPGQVNVPGGVRLREKGQPVSDAQLKEQILSHTPPGELSSGQKEHADLVRRRLYGAQTAPALFSDTLSLLTTLRGSKLGGEVKPSVVEAQLRNSLPPLSEGIRMQLGAGIDRIDRHLQVQATQERQLQAAGRIAAADFQAAEAALDLQFSLEVEAQDAERTAQQQLVSAQETVRQTALELDQTERLHASGQEELERTRAQRNNVQIIYNDQAGALQNLRAQHERARTEHERNREAQRTQQQHQARDQQRRTERLQSIEEQRVSVEAAGSALETLRWWGGEKSLPARREQLQQADGALKQFNQDTLLLRDQEARTALATGREQQAQTVLAARNMELEAELRSGAAELSALVALFQLEDGEPLPDELQEAYRTTLEVDPDLAVGLALIEPVLQGSLQLAQEQESETRGQLRQASATVTETREAFGALQRAEETSLPLPGDRQQVLQLLSDAGIVAQPFYRAVRPASEHEGNQLATLEAALLESGLLDALCVNLADQERALQLVQQAGLSEALLRAGEALPVGEALTGLLIPETGAADSLPLILGSVGRHGAGPAGVGLDGRWSNGGLQGQARGCQEIRFLGHEARVQQRQRQLEVLEVALTAALDSERRHQVTWEGIHQERTLLEQRIAQLRTQGPRQRCRTQAAQVSAEARSQQWLLAGQAEEAINDLRRLREISRGTLETLTRALEPLGAWEHGPQDSLQQSAQLILDSWLTELHRAENHWNTLRQSAQLQHQLGEMVADLDARLLAGQQQLEQLTAAARALVEERDAARESLNILEKESGPGTRELRLQLDQLTEAERRLSRREAEARTALATLAERHQQQNLQLPRLERDLQAAALRADEQRTRRLTLQARHPNLSQLDQETLFERLTGRPVTHLREEAERAAEQVQQVFIAEKGALETPHSFQPVLNEGVPVFGLSGLRATGEELRAHLEEELLQTRALLSREEAATFQGELIRELVGDLFAKQRAAVDWVQRVQNTLKKISFNGEHLGLEQGRREVAGSVSEPLSRLVDGHTDPYFAPDAWWTSVSSEVRQIIDQLRALPGADLSFAQAFEQALDYRQWIAFRFLSVVAQPSGTTRRREITDRNFSERSGGERSAVLYAYLFAAVAARFDQLGPGVPRLIGLDEAFAGMDTGNIGSLYRIMADLELSWVLTSQHPVHLNPALPAAAAYEFFRVAGTHGDSLGRLGSLWNGRTQTRLGG